MDPDDGFCSVVAGEDRIAWSRIPKAELRGEESLSRVMEEGERMEDCRPDERQFNGSFECRRGVDNEQGGKGRNVNIDRRVCPQ